MNDQTDNKNTVREPEADLENLIREVEQGKKSSVKNELDTDEQIEIERVDILNLPPRKTVHQNKGRTNLKMSRPFMRFITVMIVLALVIAGAYYFIS